MTREEAIKKLESLKNPLPAAKDEIDEIISLIKTSWISVKDDLPCNHKKLIKNENYTKKVLVVLARNDDPSKKHIEICNMCNKIGSFNTNWYWWNTAYYHVVCWRPLPELPEE